MNLQSLVLSVLLLVLINSNFSSPAPWKVIKCYCQRESIDSSSSDTSLRHGDSSGENSEPEERNTKKIAEKKESIEKFKAEREKFEKTKPKKPESAKEEKKNLKATVILTTVKPTKLTTTVKLIATTMKPTIKNEPCNNKFMEECKQRFERLNQRYIAVCKTWRELEEKYKVLTITQGNLQSMIKQNQAKIQCVFNPAEPEVPFFEYQPEEVSNNNCETLVAPVFIKDKCDDSLKNCTQMCRDVEMKIETMTLKIAEKTKEVETLQASIKKLNEDLNVLVPIANKKWEECGPSSAPQKAPISTSVILPPLKAPNITMIL